jgi:hypothetical protein
LDDCFRLAGLEPIAIELKEHNGRREGDSFVAIDERMVPREAERIGGGWIEEGGCDALVCKPVFWSRQRRLEQAGVANARRAPERCQQLFLDRNDRVAQHPDRRFHFANSRRAFR